MLRNSLSYIIFFCFISFCSFSQSIYNGGNDDGFATNCFVQADNTSLAIYSGGNDDGAATTCFIQADNTSLAIYSGGNSDGAVTTCFIQADNTSLAIYSGGNDDGAATTCFIQADNTSLAIYSGGNDDGAATTCFIQLDNSALAIYSGGNDDGAATTCFIQLDNSALAIYSGGNDDGAATTCFLQLDNTALAIYSGGVNDGFVKTCYVQSDALPISLIAFDATAYSDHVLTYWKTASEKNNNFFTVEKTKDGSTYTVVATVQGSGNSTTIMSYSTPDYAPYEGISYYRLKQTDYDGRYSYSPLVKIEFNSISETSFNVYPNPSTGENLSIAISGQKDQEILVVLYDVLGKETYSKVYVLKDNGITVSAFDPDGKLASGIYIITATSDKNITSKKIIIQ